MKLNDKCSKCGQTLRRLMLLAMIQDAGAECHPRADECSAGGDHDFEEAKMPLVKSERKT